MDGDQEYDLYSLHPLEFLGKTGIWESLAAFETRRGEVLVGTQHLIYPISLLCLIIISCGGESCEFLKI